MKKQLYQVKKKEKVDISLELAKTQLRVGFDEPPSDFESRALTIDALP